MKHARPDDWLERYLRDGVVFPLRGLTEEEACSLRVELEAFVEELLQQSNGSQEALTFKPWLSDDHPFCTPLESLARQDALVEPLQEILGPNILLRTFDLFVKRGGEHSEHKKRSAPPMQIQWHWDEPRGVTGSDGVVTVWLALTPSTTDNGCVRFVLESQHVAFDRDDPLDRYRFHVRKKDASLLEDLPRHDACLAPGEFSIHHGSVVHGSTLNVGEIDRFGIAMRYTSLDTPAEITGTHSGIVISGQIPDDISDISEAKHVPIMWWSPHTQIDMEAQNREAAEAAKRNREQEERLPRQDEAEAGDPDAQTSIGQSYLDRTHRKNDPEQAAHLFQKAAQQGHPEALYALGNLLEEGRGIPRDEDAAIHHWKQAAEKDHPGALTRLALRMERGQGLPTDLQKARLYLQRAAVAGDADAQYEFGRRLHRGAGLPQDLPAAADWYRQAAELGHARSQNAWGKMLDKGLGVEQNLEEAFHWLEKAAGQGQVGAQTRVGVMLRDGVGVPANPEEAAKWFKKAAVLGHVHAQVYLGHMLWEGKDIAQDQSEAARWFQEAARKGNEIALAWAKKSRPFLNDSDDENA